MYTTKCMYTIDVPYYSQHRDVSELHWKKRSCGIVCVKMILDFLKPELPVSIDALIDEAVLMNGYTAHGWSHDALVNLFHNHGQHAYREEFKSMHIDVQKRTKQPSAYESLLVRNGISKIVHMLRKGKPVIVSVEKGFDDNTSTHLIVLTGMLDTPAGCEGFFYNDPNSVDGVKKHVFVELSKFRTYWRKLAIFVS